MPKGNRISFEEKGQRTARSTDVYLGDKGLKEVTVCTECMAFYRDKRWNLPEGAVPPKKGEIAAKVVCPACQRIKDRMPAGRVTLSGDYVDAHVLEIMNRIRNIETATKKKNPLSRIMELKREGSAIVILTTSDKLAQKLGRDLYKANRGTLTYNWTDSEGFLRVSWVR